MNDLKDFKPTIKDILVEDGLQAAIKRLKSLFHPASKAYNDLLLLELQLKETNRLMLRRSISDTDLELRYNRLSERFITFLDNLDQQDLEAGQTGRYPQQGSLLYQIPGAMELKKEVHCRVRIAHDKTTLQENLDPNVDARYRELRIAEVMEAELMDPSEPNAFFIRSFNRQRDQLIVEGEYTEWLFYVTPLRTGRFPIILRVTAIEMVNDKERVRDIVLEETIVIVAEPVSETVARFKYAGHVSGATATISDVPEPSPGQSPEPSTLPAPQPAAPVPSSTPRTSSFQRVAWVLAGVMVLSGLSYAVSPVLRENVDWLIASSIDSPAAYQKFARRHEGSLKAQIARERVELMDWETLVKNPSTQGVEDFIARHPDGRFIKNAVELLSKLGMPPIMRPGTKAAIEKYGMPLQPAEQSESKNNDTADKPGTYAEEAPGEVKKSTLEKEKQQDIPSEKAKANSQSTPHKSTSSSSPESKRTRPPVDVPIDYGRINPPLNRKIDPTPKVIDEEYDTWQAVRKAFTCEKFKQFIEKYPRSLYEDEARYYINLLCGPIPDDRRELGAAAYFDQPFRAAITPPANSDAGADLSYSAKGPSIQPPQVVRVAGSNFFMGDIFTDDPEGRDPVRRVVLSGFYIGRYEVTFDEYDAFCEATGRKKPDDGNWGRGKKPVINVNWLDAVAYCNWLSRQAGLGTVYTISGSTVTADWKADGYRLPTEAEWEFAARGGGQHVRFGNGRNVADPKEINFNGSSSYIAPYSIPGESRGRTAEAGSFPPNSLGLHEMSGNVWEWCWDWYAGYPSETENDPKGPQSGSFRVCRGGSWQVQPADARAAARGYVPATFKSDRLGFRVARSAR